MINRREFLGAAAALALPPRPNIVFILADDLGNFDLGCYGQKLIRTPQIDRIAAEGVRFTQASAGATVCAPTRTCLMTGQHAGHATVRANHSLRTKERVPLSASDVTVAQVLRSAGYATGIFGKWGLGEPDTTGLPNRHGFDDWFGFLNQDHAVDYYTDCLWRNGKKETLAGNLNGGRKEYTTDLFTREAKRFIRERRRDPFFLYLAYTAPHKDLMVPRDEWYSRENWSGEDKLYAAMVTWMDRGIGEVMALLKELKIDDNTIVFFSSDNGAGHKAGIPRFHSTGPFRGAKSEVWEGGIRAPLLARWPGRIKAGAVSEHPCAFWDFLPTAAELAGAKPPAKIDGLSVVPALIGGRQPRHEFLYWENPGKRFEQAVRLGDWKAIRRGLSGPIALYNLAADIGETTDVASANPGVVKRAEEILRTVRTDAPDYPVRSFGVV
ncbi:MAG: arylsulfatase [Acidobacteria bacterium]|nr:arylsulfatase [Acidobacteriota bacterium]